MNRIRDLVKENTIYSFLHWWYIAIYRTGFAYISACHLSIQRIMCDFWLTFRFETLFRWNPYRLRWLPSTKRIRDITWSSQARLNPLWIRQVLHEADWMLRKEYSRGILVNMWNVIKCLKWRIEPHSVVYSPIPIELSTHGGKLPVIVEMDSIYLVSFRLLVRKAGTIFMAPASGFLYSGSSITRFRIAYTYWKRAEAHYFCLTKTLSVSGRTG